jgi:hypothetical protein
MKAIAWRAKDIEDIRQIVSTNSHVNWSWTVETVSEFAELLEVPERIPAIQALIQESQ